MIACPKCGSQVLETNQFCSTCGAQIHLGGPPASSVSLPGQQSQTSGKAVASMVLGICIFVLGFLTGVPAIIFGHLAKSDIKKSGGRLQGDGMALAGLILGYLSVAFIPLVLIIAAIAIPNLLRARMAANEAATVGSLRAITAAAINYSSTYGHGFPKNLTILGPRPDVGTSSEDAADLIDAALARGQKYGYSFTYQASSSRDNGVLDLFQVNADPVIPNSTGRRHFFVDQTGLIRVQDDAAADEHSPPIQ